MSVVPMDSKSPDRNVVFKKLMPIPSKKPTASHQKSPKHRRSTPWKSTVKLSAHNIDNIVQENEKLKKMLEALTRDFETTRLSESIGDLERSKISHFWSIAKEELHDKRGQLTDLEQRLHESKTQHIAKISSLNKHISMLTTDSTMMQRGNSTQTTTNLQTANSTCDVSVQTSGDSDEQNLNDTLRMEDGKLMELITELEREKLQASIEHQLLLVQMEREKKEREEHAVRQLREENERHLEELARAHSEEIGNREGEYKDALESHLQKIQKLQKENDTLAEEAQERLVQLEVMKSQAETMELQISKVTRESQFYETTRSELCDLRVSNKKNEKELSRVRSELDKANDIREIILGEYRKIEKERNELIAEFEKCITNAERLSSQRNKRLSRRFDRPF